MKAFEFNKIAGAVLAALLVLTGTRILVHELRGDEGPEKPGYVVEIAAVEKTTSGGGSATDAAVGPSFAELLANASADAGKKVFKKCAACHTRKAGAGNRVGPNLFGIVNRDIAAADGFAYSAALTAKEGDWTEAELDSFLTSPKKYAKGTKMGFSGIKKPEQRASLIKYLGSLK